MMPFFFVWDTHPKHVRPTLCKEAHEPQTRYLGWRVFSEVGDKEGKTPCAITGHGGRNAG